MNNFRANFRYTISLYLIYKQILAWGVKTIDFVNVFNDFMYKVCNTIIHKQITGLGFKSIDFTLVSILFYEKQKKTFTIQKNKQ